MGIYVYNQGVSGGGEPLPEDVVTKTNQYLDYYVDPTNGDDNLGDGSYDNPYKTITHIFDNILPDVIVNEVDITIKGNIHNISSPILDSNRKLYFKDGGFISITGEYGSCDLSTYNNGTILQADLSTWSGNPYIFNINGFIHYGIYIDELSFSVINVDNNISNVSDFYTLYIKNSQIKLGSLSLFIPNDGTSSTSNIAIYKINGIYINNSDVFINEITSQARGIPGRAYQDSNNYGYAGSISEIQGDYSSVIFITGFYRGLELTSNSYLYSSMAFDDDNTGPRTLVITNCIGLGLSIWDNSFVRLSKLIIYNLGDAFTDDKTITDDIFGLMLYYNSSLKVINGGIIHSTNASGTIGNTYLVDGSYNVTFYNTSSHPVQVQETTQTGVYHYYFAHFGNILWVTYGGTLNYILDHHYEVLHSPVSAISWTYLEGV